MESISIVITNHKISRVVGRRFIKYLNGKFDNFRTVFYTDVLDSSEDRFQCKGSSVCVAAPTNIASCYICLCIGKACKIAYFEISVRLSAQHLRSNIGIKIKSMKSISIWVTDFEIIWSGSSRNVKEGDFYFILSNISVSIRNNCLIYSRDIVCNI